MSLSKFANALRDVLGLTPLYRGGRGRERERAEEAERFYREPVAWGRSSLYDIHGMRRKTS